MMNEPGVLEERRKKRKPEMLNEPVACCQPCILCEATEARLISLADRDNRFLRTVICTRCGLIWSDPPPREDQLQAFYSTNYRKEYKGIRVPKGKHLHRDACTAMRRFRFLAPLLRPRDRILDVGAGSGVFVYVLNKLGHMTVGIGPDEGHSRFAREHLHCEVRTGFAKDVDEKEAFAVVTLHHVLEHMGNPLAELRHIRTLLRPAGYLVVELPNAEDVWQDPGNRYHKAHVFTFDSRTLPALLEKAGFSVIEQALAPLNRNITALAQKRSGESAPPASLHDNYERIREIIGGHHPARYYTSLVPYRKFLLNSFKKLRELTAIRSLSGGQEIIDAVIAEEMPCPVPANNGILGPNA